MWWYPLIDNATSKKMKTNAKWENSMYWASKVLTSSAYLVCARWPHFTSVLLPIPEIESAGVRYKNLCLYCFLSSREYQYRNVLTICWHLVGKSKHYLFWHRSKKNSITHVAFPLAPDLQVVSCGKQPYQSCLVKFNREYTSSWPKNEIQINRVKRLASLFRYPIRLIPMPPTTKTILDLEANFIVLRRPIGENFGCSQTCQPNCCLSCGNSYKNRSSDVAEWFSAGTQH